MNLTKGGNPVQNWSNGVQQRNRMKSVPKLLSLFLCLNQLGCASMSNRTKTILTTLGAGAIGGGLGYVTSPETMVPTGHAAVWGGASAATAGILSLFLYDSEKDKRRLYSENERLGLELASFQEGITPHLVDVVHESPNMPDSLRKHFKPGDWAIYKVGGQESALWKPRGNSGNYLENVCRVAIYTKGGLRPLAPSQMLDAQSSDSNIGTETLRSKEVQTSQPKGVQQ